MSQKFVKGYGDEVYEFLKAFGIDFPVTSFDLNIPANGVVTANVEYYVTEDQLGEAAKLAKKYVLTELDLIPLAIEMEETK